MDDSNIYYYLVLGAIYIISRFLKKKKPPESTPDFETNEPHATPHKTVSSPSSVEDILKEFSKQFEVKEETEPSPIEVVHKKPEPVPNYQEQNIEAIRPDEEIDIVPHKPIERKEIKFERLDAFSLEEEEEENDVRVGVLELLKDEDGMRKAVILKEILDRKY